MLSKWVSRDGRNAYVCSSCGLLADGLGARIDELQTAPSYCEQNGGHRWLRPSQVPGNRKRAMEALADAEQRGVIRLVVTSTEGGS